MANRRTMAATGSTSSTGTGGRAAAMSTPRIRSSPRRVISRVAESSTSRVYSLNISYRRVRVACCSLNTVSGLNRCCSPSRRHWYSPPVSSRWWASPAPRPRSASPDPATPPHARACRAATSAASTSNPAPPSRDVVPVTQVPMISPPTPIASKIWAPW